MENILRRQNYSNFGDHKLSADPKEMVELVKSVRRSSVMVGTYAKKFQKMKKKFQINETFIVYKVKINRVKK